MAGELRLSWLVEGGQRGRDRRLWPIGRWFTSPVRPRAEQGDCLGDRVEVGGSVAIALGGVDHARRRTRSCPDRLRAGWRRRRGSTMAVAKTATHTGRPRHVAQPGSAWPCPTSEGTQQGTWSGSEAGYRRGHRVDPARSPNVRNANTGHRVLGWRRSSPHREGAMDRPTLGAADVVVTHGSQQALSLPAAGTPRSRRRR